MSHDQFQSWIESARDGQLPADQQAALEDHLAGCESCRAYRHDFLERENALRAALSAASAPPQLTQQDLRKAAGLIRKRRRNKNVLAFAGQAVRSVSWAALTLTIVLGLNWLFNSFSRTPPQPAATAMNTVGAPPQESFAPIIAPTPAPSETVPSTPFVPFSRQLRLTLGDGSSPVTSLAFSPDGSIVAAAASDGKIRIWRVRDGALLRTLDAHEKEATSVAFSPDGELLVSGGRDGDVQVWLPKTGAFVKTLMSVSSQVEELQFSPTGDLLAVTLSNRMVTLVRVSDGQQLDTFESSIRLDVNQASDRNSYLIASAESAIWIHGKSDVPFTLNIQGQSGRSLDVVLSSSGSLLASGSTTGLISLWKIFDLTVRDETNAVNGIARVSRTITGNLIYNLTGHEGWVNNLDFSADSRFLVSGGEDGTVILWSLAEGEFIGQLLGHTGPVTSVDVSPDDQLIASGSHDGTVRIWALEELDG